MADKARRRQHIMELLERETVASQEELGKLLVSKGIDVTQATLSRDLRDLGVLKGPRGYVLPHGENGHSSAPATDTIPVNSPLEATLRTFMISANEAGSMIVFRTRPGHAPALAMELDRANVSGVVGTIAGDDTVFVAAATPSKAKSITRMARSLSARG